MDAKDILGLARTPLPERKSLPKKDSQRKPDGISREVYALTGGLAPLMPSLDSSYLKKPPPSDDKITWQWLPFTSSARKDSLQLYHWGRVVNGVPPTGDYSFAKYNKSVEAIKYTDEEYQQHLTDPSWTKQETDQLFDLCEQFGLRFVIVADRFPSSRTMEELKDRYYTASRSILLARASNPADVSGHPLVKVRSSCSSFPQILAEAKKITEARIAARGTDESVTPVAENDFVETTVNHDESVMPPSNVRFAPSDLVIADTASTLASLRMITLKPKVPTKAVCGEHLELRKEILTLLNLQKQLQYKEAEGCSAREGAHSEMPGTPKRLVHERAFIPDMMGFGGNTCTFSSTSLFFFNLIQLFQVMMIIDMPRLLHDSFFIPVERGGRKDQKRKGPGRVSERPSSPANKRPRKMKAADF
ncbi:SWR1-complex protein 4 [Linum grandiflorum]